MNRNDRQTFALLLVQVAVVYLGGGLGGSWVALGLGGAFWLGGYASKCISLHTFRRFSLRRKSSGSSLPV